MSKIANAFQNKKAFIGFLTAGDPSLDKTEEFILEMERAGADLIEIGIPFSDPIAEGVVIQDANIRALSVGTTTDKIFAMVEGLRKKTQIPLAFMTYLNPVFHYGYERFFARCEEVGIDGIIIPDMPYEEKGELEPIAKAHGVDVISLIATTDLDGILAAVKRASDLPAAVGFGINKPEQAARIGKIADGVIVGSAIVKIIEKYGAEAGPHVYEYVHSMKEALKTAE